MKRKKTVKKAKSRTMLSIVKRKGHAELYDERKVYGSCFFSCRNAHLDVEESEQICGKVTAQITKWVKKKKLVTSDDIFRAITNELKKHNEDASFLYETHRDIS